MITLNYPKQCSKCNSTNATEAWENGNLIVRCNSCGHQSIKATMTTTTNTSATPIHFQYVPIIFNNVETF